MRYFGVILAFSSFSRQIAIFLVILILSIFFPPVKSRYFDIILEFSDIFYFRFLVILNFVLGSQFDIRRDMFLQELKNSNNKNRLLTDKMNGTTVFKIPDELWDRSYPMFCVELLGKNIKLECRPHGFTEDDVPVYTRTGKVANKLPYPEDIVRYEKSAKIDFPNFFPNFSFQMSRSFTSLEN